MTTFPDVTDLYLAADLCVTDYSSVMFDFTVTGKPILFFVPDLNEYRDEIRGMYFKLDDVSPGPMVETTADLARAVMSLDRVSEQYAVRYRDWQARFNAWDDGDATARACDAMFAAGEAVIGTGGA